MELLATFSEFCNAFLYDERIYLNKQFRKRATELKPNFSNYHLLTVKYTNSFLQHCILSINLGTCILFLRPFTKIIKLSPNKTI